MFSLPGWLNYKILNGPPFWVHYTPSNIIPEECQVLHTYRSAPPVFDHGVQVFSSADKDELLAQHFDRTHHFNLHVGTTNRVCMVNRTFNSYSRHPTHTSLSLSSQTPYEIRRLIQSLIIKSPTGPGGISATML